MAITDPTPVNPELVHFSDSYDISILPEGTTEAELKAIVLQGPDAVLPAGTVRLGAMSDDAAEFNHEQETSNARTNTNNGQIIRVRAGDKTVTLTFSPIEDTPTSRWLWNGVKADADGVTTGGTATIVNVPLLFRSQDRQNGFVSEEFLAGIAAITPNGGRSYQRGDTPVGFPLMATFIGDYHSKIHRLGAAMPPVEDGE